MNQEPKVVHNLQKAEEQFYTLIYNIPFVFLFVGVKRPLASDSNKARFKHKRPDYDKPLPVICVDFSNGIFMVASSRCGLPAPIEMQSHKKKTNSIMFQ